MGRKEKPENEKKKARTISTTDGEWDQVKKLAGDMEISAFILKKLKIKSK